MERVSINPTANAWRLLLNRRRKLVESVLDNADMGEFFNVKPVSARGLYHIHQLTLRMGQTMDVIHGKHMMKIRNRQPAACLSAACLRQSGFFKHAPQVISVD